jgi:hypothetical protein
MEGRTNPYKLPRGDSIRLAMIEVYRAQRAAVLRFLRTGKKDQGAALPSSIPTMDDLGVGTITAAERMTPLLTQIWDEAAQKFAPRVGLDPDEWSVINPHTERMIEERAMVFCQETNTLTEKKLDNALTELKQQLKEGIVQEGESVSVLAKRIQGVFEHMEGWKARQIAHTETSYAVHAAQEQAAIASGVVTGWRWRASADACKQICLAIAARAPAVRLGEAFATIGTNPHYAKVKFPPGHPYCNCTVEEVLDTDEQPTWHDTLQDPHPASDEEVDQLARQHSELANQIQRGGTGRNRLPASPERRIPKPPKVPKPKPTARRVSGTPQPPKPIAAAIRAMKGHGRLEALKKIDASELARMKDAHKGIEKEIADYIRAHPPATMTDVDSRWLAGRRADLKTASTAYDAAAVDVAEQVAAALGHGGQPIKTAATIKTSNPALASRARGAIKAIEGICTDVGTTVNIDVSQRDGRAGYNPAKKVLSCSSNTRLPVIAHEFGHVLENHSPAIKARTQEFLSYRVGKETPRKLSEVLPTGKYGTLEYGRKDRFDRYFGVFGWYVGKVYPNDTEVLSMGLEALFEDPKRFAQKDPEFCKFVVGILSGELR